MVNSLCQPRLLLALLLTSALILLVQFGVGWTALLAPWRALDPMALAGAATLALLSYVLRAARLYDHFLPLTRGSFGTVLRLVLLHNAANNLAPMRTGEAAFPLLLQRYFAVPLVRSLGALLWLRLMDAHALGAIALLALGRLWLPLEGWLPLLALWLALPLVGQLGWGRKFLSRRLSPRWRQRLAQAGSGLPRNRAALWRCWGWSLAVWGVKLAAFAWIVHRFAGLSLDLGLLGAVGGELTSVLPFHGLAGAGTYEAGVAAALLPFGVAPERVLIGAVNLHLFLLGLSLAAAGGALLRPVAQRQADYG